MLILQNNNTINIDVKKINKINKINNETEMDDFRQGYDEFIFENKDNGLLNKIRNIFHQIHGICFFGDVNFFYRIINFFYIPVFVVNKSNNILDIGCSTGNFLENLKKKGLKKYGIEISKNAILLCKQKNINIISDTIENLNINIKFDIVRSCHVIEHINDYELHIDKIIDHLSDDGMLIIYTPNYQSLSALITGSSREGYYENTHCSIFSIDSIVSLIESKGLKLIGFGSYPMGYSIASFMRLLNIKSIYFFYICFIIYYPIACILSKIFNKRGGALAVCFQK